MKLKLTVEELLKILPSGSGFNTSWGYDELKNGKVVFYTGYHCMDEWGGYDGWCDFSIKVNLDDPTDFTLNFRRGSHGLERKYMLREYIDDTINYVITEYLKEREKNNV